MEEINSIIEEMIALDQVSNLGWVIGKFKKLKELEFLIR